MAGILDSQMGFPAIDWLWQDTNALILGNRKSFLFAIESIREGGRNDVISYP